MIGATTTATMRGLTFMLFKRYLHQKHHPTHHGHHDLNHLNTQISNELWNEFITSTEPHTIGSSNVPTTNPPPEIKEVSKWIQNLSKNQKGRIQVGGGNTTIHHQHVYTTEDKGSEVILIISSFNILKDFD